MCLPKAPKEDPAIRQQQKMQRQVEQERLAEEKKKDLAGQRRMIRGSGMRSLISGESGSGFIA
jgi:hypothetical protein